MSEKKQWKFVFIYGGWWLQITDLEQLMEYIELTENRYGFDITNICHGDSIDRDSNGFTVNLEEEPIKEENSRRAFEVVNAAINEISLLESIIDTSSMINMGYIDTLRTDGLININCVGGYNSDKIIPEIVVYKDVPKFPHFTSADINIQTFKNIDSEKDYGYHYHFYAYLGNVQIRDGNKMKWDSYDEAYEFARRYIDEECPKR